MRVIFVEHRGVLERRRQRHIHLLGLLRCSSAREPPLAAAFFSCEHRITLAHKRQACRLPPGIPFAFCSSLNSCSSSGGCSSHSGVSRCGSGVIRGAAVCGFSFASVGGWGRLRRSRSRSSPSAHVGRASGLLRALLRSALAVYDSTFRLCSVGGVSRRPPAADKLLPLPCWGVFALQRGKRRDGETALLLVEDLLNQFDELPREGLVRYKARAT